MTPSCVHSRIRIPWAAAGGGAAAQVQASANPAIASDCVWHGCSQSEDSAAPAGSRLEVARPAAF